MLRTTALTLALVAFATTAAQAQETRRGDRALERRIERLELRRDAPPAIHPLRMRALDRLPAVDRGDRRPGPVLRQRLLDRARGQQPFAEERRCARPRFGLRPFERPKGRGGARFADRRQELLERLKERREKRRERIRTLTAIAPEPPPERRAI